jgi:hypothetical protein
LEVYKGIGLTGFYKKGLTMGKDVKLSLNQVLQKSLPGLPEDLIKEPIYPAMIAMRLSPHEWKIILEALPPEPAMPGKKPHGRPPGMGSKVKRLLFQYLKERGFK